ncbi:haloacid dehalogenase-like hydrolase [Candidatus Vidania fulgoroideorum]
MTINVFDLDKTLIAKDIEYFFIYFLYKQSRVKKKILKKSLNYYKKYIKNKLNFNKYLKYFYKIFCKNKKKIQPFFKKIKKNIYKTTFALFKNKTHKIISTSSVCVFDNYIKTLFKSNIISTRIKTKNFKNYKVVNICKYLIKKKYKKIFFYTDSVNDLPMINFCNKSLIVNANFLFIKKIYSNKAINFIFLKTIL